ncbi:MAG: DNA repair protein RecN, partial [Candidatus Marinimicrobia bacterium]|nr:DNA repair protein RecN [Candidatus Neomarinimicrobiota bacterium]
VGTLIFDEVDSGISGETADRVGNTIEALSNSHQIICITHLSQIAGKGDSHYKVHKEMKNGRNISQIKLLSHSERIEEIASLISGKKISKMSKAKAKELLLENG